MPEFKTCDNGHNYDASLYAVCPFCPVGTDNTDYEKTMNEFKKTRVYDIGHGNPFDKTMIDEDSIDFQKTQVDDTPHPFSRTTIAMDNSAGQGAAPPGQRKLVGWVVTFSNDEFGQDYRLYNGKNKIGSGPECDIIIRDSSVSADHCTILFRENEFLIKDNFSTNGTKINGTSTEEGKLNEGDEIKLGNTSLKFKTVF